MNLYDKKKLKEAKHRILLKDGSTLHFHPPFHEGESLKLQDFLLPHWKVGQTLEVEIGCGKGEFIARRAAQFPDRFFVGIDRRLDRHRLTEKKLSRINCESGKNWVVVFEDARAFLDHEIPPLSALHIYHPDPWPKNRHHKHRLFRSPVAKRWAEALKPGGILRLSTDHKEYYEEILAILETWDFLERITYFKKRRGEPVTHFENIFLSKGEPVYKACYFRK